MKLLRQFILVNTIMAYPIPSVSTYNQSVLHPATINTVYYMLLFNADVNVSFKSILPLKLISTLKKSLIYHIVTASTSHHAHLTPCVY